MIGLKSTRDRKRDMRGTQLADVGVAIVLVVLVILFPALDFISVGYGLAVVSFAADAAARSAGSADTWGEAQMRVHDSRQQFLGGSGGLASLTPVGNGLTLSVEVVPHDGSQPSDFSSQLSDNSSPNPYTSDDYQYVVTATYMLSPVINFQSSSLFSNIPILGAPLPVKMVARAHVERVEGLHT